MAWIQVQLQGWRSTSSVDTKERKATDYYIVRSDTPTTPVAAERASFGGVTIPVRGNSHPSDSTRKFAGVSAKVLDESNRTEFEVQVDYSDSSTAQAATDNPLNKVRTYEWGWDDKTEQWFYDRSATPKAWANSAGDKFIDFPPDRDCGSLVCTVKRNVAYASFNESNYLPFKNVVNSAGVTIDGVSFGAKKVKTKGVTAGPKTVASYVDDMGTTQTVTYREVSVVLQCKDPSSTDPTEVWDVIVQDKGFNQLKAGKLVAIMKGTPANVPVDSPWPLNGSGVTLASSTLTPSSLTLSPYFVLSFGPLGLS